MHHFGIDLGGTKIAAALCGDQFGEPLWRTRVPTETGRGPTGLIGQLAGLIAEGRDRASGPITIGLGLPGSIDPANGLVRNCVLPWLDGVALPAELSAAAGSPVALVNDADAFALSEAQLGAGRGHRMVLGLTLGTGVGGGLAIDGKLWTGRHGIAGEIGHACLERGGRSCYCGRRGCIEQYLSGTALERRYAELCGTERALADIHERNLAGGDAAARLVMQELVEAFGLALGSLVNLLDPDVIVLGGGVSRLPLLYDQGVRAVAAQAMAMPFTTPVLPGALGDASGVFGAALVGAQQLHAKSAGGLHL